MVAYLVATSMLSVDLVSTISLYHNTTIVPLYDHIVRYTGHYTGQISQVTRQDGLIHWLLDELLGS